MRVEGECYDKKSMDWQRGGHSSFCGFLLYLFSANGYGTVSFDGDDYRNGH